MRQFDVYRNPSAISRTAFPFLIVLQHDRVTGTYAIIVAPLVPPFVTAPASRLYPIVNVNGREFMMLTPDLASLPRSLFKQRTANLDDQRDKIIGALDLLFAGS